MKSRDLNHFCVLLIIFCEIFFSDFLINFHIFNQHNYGESRRCYDNQLLILINLDNECETNR